MSKKISWLEKFAEDRAVELKKTASLNKKAAQVIVDCNDCPDATVGSEVTYKNEKYKVVQTDFQDELGAGVVLEKVADGEDAPSDGEDDGQADAPIEATAGLDDLKKEDEEKTDETSEAPETPADSESENTEDVPADDDLKEEELPADPAEQVIPETSAIPAEVTNEVPVASNDQGTAPVSPAAQPITMAPAGGPKASPSADIVGPGQKKVTDAPYHPTTDPGDAYNIEVRDTTEVSDAQASAAETEQAIAAEDAVDRTNVSGHYTWNQNRILDRMVTDLTGVQPPAAEEAPVTEEAPVAEEMPATEEVKDESSVDEGPTEEDKKNRIAVNSILKKIING